MSKFIRFAALLTVVATSFAPTAIARADLPLLIPRQVIFGNPVKVALLLSPDGKKLAYLAPADGVLNIFVKTIGQSDDHAITKSKLDPIRDFYWAANGRQIVYQQDTAGNESPHIYCIEVETGVQRDLSHGIIIGTNPDFPNTLIVEDNTRVAQLHDSYRLDLVTGEKEMAGKNPGNVMQWLSDSKLQVRAAVTMEADGSAQLLVRETESAPFHPLLKVSPEEGIQPMVFSKDGQNLFLASNLGVNNTGLYEINVKTGALRLIYSCPDISLSLALFSNDKKLQAVNYNKFRREWKTFDPRFEADFRVLSKALSGDFNLVSRDTKDENWIVACASDNAPLTYYSYHRATRKLDFLFTAQPELEKYRLATMKPLEIRARDGLKLVSYLTLPVGVPAKNLPLVLDVHGGPWSRDSWGYNSEVQWLANRGYAVLQVNFRGSSGFGKRFLNAGDREWGGKMQDDLVDAVHWAIGEGIADPKRVAIYGASYGGFAALTGLTKTPELFACGVDVVGVSNLLTFLQTIRADWEISRPMQNRRIGNPQTDAEFLKSRSPVFFADKIVRPLLIAQGANDSRVKQEESDQIVRAIRSNGHEVTYLLFSDEGHGFARPANKLKFYAATEAFLSRYLGGRAQAAQAGEEPPLVAPGQEGGAPKVVETWHLSDKRKEAQRPHLFGFTKPGGK